MQARLSLHMSKYHTVGNHMPRLICSPHQARESILLLRDAFHDGGVVGE